MRRILVIFLTIMATVAQAQESKLDAVRSEVRDSQPSQTDNSKKKSDCTDSGLDFSELSFNPFEVLETLLCFRHNPNNYEPTTFVAYPYAQGWPGLLQIGMERNKIDGVTPSTWEHLMSVRASVEEGNDFNGINRLGIVFLADTLTHVGIGGGVHWYDETRKHCSHDQLMIGDINLLWRHYQTDSTQARMGLGTRFLSDRVQTDWGFNFVYGFDWFPKQPWSIGTQLETGTLGNAWVFRATGRIGLVWKYSEVYAGYDYLRIGSTELQGPMVGLRIWF